MAFSDGKTTIVLGAGASCEAGLPIGRELKGRIAELVNINYSEFGSRISGSREIDSVFRQKGRDRTGCDLDAYLHACRQIRDAMPQAISIDNYLDAHAKDEATVLAGKLAIAQAILEAERSSTLYVDRFKAHEMIRFNSVEGSTPFPRTV